MGMSTVLAVIPARGGSKGIPRKNVRLLAGKPLIAWTIKAASQSQMLTRVIVSTDDAEIAQVAREWGAETPFLRPPELAQDMTPGMDPILHAINWLWQYEGYAPDYVMSLQPTSPLRTVDDINSAIQLVLDKQGKAVVSVNQVAYHPYGMKRIDANGCLSDFMPGKAVVRRQDLPQVYALNGAIYLARRELLLNHQTWYGNQTFAYVMSTERSLDIDTLWDWRLAELVLKDQYGQA